MEVIEGATPKGLEEAGVGETPLLEMVLPGVTAIPGAGDEPGSQREGREGGVGYQTQIDSFRLCRFQCFLYRISWDFSLLLVVFVLQSISTL